MTQCIDPSDPRYFTQTSDKSYDRHKYQINLTNGKSVVFDDYEDYEQHGFRQTLCF